MSVSVLCLSTFMSLHESCEITRTPLSCGGDECDADLLSLLRQSYIQTCILVCMRIYLFDFRLFAFLSIPESYLPNSLFLLNTAQFICTTTSLKSTVLE
jgi:hypothetical protein